MPVFIQHFHIQMVKFFEQSCVQLINFQIIMVLIVNPATQTVKLVRKMRRTAFLATRIGFCLQMYAIKLVQLALSP